MRKTYLIIISIIAVLLIFLLSFGFYFQRNEPKEENVVKTETMDVTVVGEDLYVPWSVAFLPTGELLAIERNGNLKVIDQESKKAKISVQVSNVIERGEGGLVGLALHPDYQNNKFIYLYYTTRNGEETINRVSRYTFDQGNLKLDKVLIDNIPGGANHNGGRLAFSPDKKLYIMTGDAGREELAQNRNSLAGKILRINDDGSVPNDNPFKNEVYALGLRNPQGMAWDGAGNLWVTDHGRSGALSGFDEINLIEKGANYGWPVIQGDETREGMKTPALHSGPRMTWAPSGIAFKNGRLYFAGLRGQVLYETEILEGGKLSEPAIYFKDQYGRLREAILGTDSFLYVTTSNRDGRGSVREKDDKILRIEI
jgi:glucose/arabinose dehydrogenase